MSQLYAFVPIQDTDANDGTVGDTTAINITASNVARQIAGANAGALQWRFYNSGTAIAFVNWAPTQALAVAVIPVDGTPAAGFVVAPGEDAVFTVSPNAQWLGVIGSAANGTLYVIPGEGM
jgi:uncharacterized protein